MSVVVAYALSAFPNLKASAPKLLADVKANATITTALLHVGSDRVECRLEFDAALDAAEQAALDALVAAHSGVSTLAKFHASSTLLVNEVPVIELVGWQVLGKVRSNPSFFIADMAGVVGRMVGEVKTIGAGLRLRIVEKSAGVEVDMTPTPFAAPDSGGAWAPIKFETQVPPRAGDNTYRLEGKTDALTVASVDACALALLEIVQS